MARLLHWLAYGSANPGGMERAIEQQRERIMRKACAGKICEHRHRPTWPLPHLFIDCLWPVARRGATTLAPPITPSAVPVPSPAPISVSPPHVPRAISPAQLPDSRSMPQVKEAHAPAALRRTGLSASPPLWPALGAVFVKSGRPTWVRSEPEIILLQ